MVSGKKLQEPKRIFIIAEAGVNHNGSLKRAKQLIDRAAAAGVDAIKFQTFKAAALVSRYAEKAKYQRALTGTAQSHLEMIRGLELDLDDHRQLLKHCREKKILFLSSPFDESSVDLLVTLNLPLIKIPSGEITNLPFLEYIGRKRKPLILSTGMCTLGEVERALQVIFAAGGSKITLLHCVTEYPAPYGEINLRAMETMRRAFGLPVGYSDHSPGIEISVAAAALGAEVIEKHFTLDRGLPGPDHRASLEPDELGAMVRAIRNVEAALGDGLKVPAESEVKNIVIARKSLVAAEEIAQGERITSRKVTLKRPGSGIQPAELDRVWGRRAKHALKVDEVISWKDLE